MATICPYCNIEVSESAIEAEDGCCPECGSVISASSSFLGEDPSEFDDGINDDELFEDFDEEEDDIFERGEFDDEVFDDEDLDEEFDEEFDDEEEEEF
ncbi:hypothetical protein FYJ85_16415 [Victivallaceae bacterium BBE-744-WT-12]|jgi:hypothetical protein|uniref:Uncharacterized protein n=1 Tax=Victivallis lenta TaxID=2606640 RepID=A0A844G6N9_9BACT|nr:hypothetical protein [Victivallis lenta]AVM47002.1 hypothetical protein C5Q97_20660 [Victivallales bacterium CCUG 44730]MBS5533163.1 hypothetical protein [bacterium]MST98624.1 hypothetical protein [Victivallis lenta]HBP06055.1 hypothetical protein [Lentisphaeria bacterium]